MPIDLELQKEAAKIGMTATLGATVVTSMFMKNKIAKNVHVIAGVAFCGFALWHHTLYQSKKSKNKIPQTTKKEALSTN